MIWSSSDVTFPYALPALDLTVPLDSYRGSVLANWVDVNKHMNMAYYLVAFDKATDVLLEQLGLAGDYTQHELGMTFVVEAHVTYERELYEGEPIRIATQIVDRNAKLIHLFHTMFHGEKGYGVATNEVLLLNVDFKTRRSAPWPEACTERLEALATAHRALPRPAGSGRRIELRRS
jgi:acyl-CoA thioester hydrolase